MRIPPAGAAIVVAGALALGPLIATRPRGIALGATVPPLCAAAAVMLVRRRDGATVAHLAALAWGAIGAAFLASAANDALLDWLGGLAGEAAAHAVVPAVVAPVVEELAKAIGLVAIVLLQPAAMRSVADGIVCGALVGLGFTLTENVGYLTLAAVQGGAAALDRALWVRAVLGGFTHAVFSATVGAGIGWARISPRRSAHAVAGSVAFVLAVVQHTLWNAVASERITQTLCNPIVVGGPCRDSPEAVGLLVGIPLVVAAGLAPGVLGLWTVLVWAGRRR